jgi:DNA-binding winged helix-turn-helix (wHTH) protein
VALTPMAFETLVALIERRGRLIEKDELFKALWPDTFVEEHNLPNNISTLRKALGEAKNAVQYIEIVPKRGYRFVAEVEELPVEMVIKPECGFHTL